MIRAASVLVLAAGCATTANVCPAGTTPARTHEAQWCQRGTALSGRMDGPYTSWHPNGARASRGRYAVVGTRSVPDGLWEFWYPNGQPRMLGAFRAGEPTGCFAVWDDAGVRRTGYLERDALRVTGCTPPVVPAPQPTSIRADVALHGFAGAGPFGARNAQQVDPSPVQRVAFAGTARARFGRVRIGPTVAFRVADNTAYDAFSIGGVVGVGLPSFHPRVDLEAAVELGAQHITATASRPDTVGSGEVDFWSPLGALQIQLGAALTASFEVTAALRVEGAPVHNEDRRVRYCDFLACAAPVRETWEVGGVAYGVDVGIRILID